MTRTSILLQKGLLLPVIKTAIDSPAQGAFKGRDGLGKAHRCLFKCFSLSDQLRYDTTPDHSCVRNRKDLAMGEGFNWAKLGACLKMISGKASGR